MVVEACVKDFFLSARGFALRQINNTAQNNWAGMAQGKKGVTLLNDNGLIFKVIQTVGFYWAPVSIIPTLPRVILSSSYLMKDSQIHWFNVCLSSEGPKHTWIIHKVLIQMSVYVSIIGPEVRCTHTPSEFQYAAFSQPTSLKPGFFSLNLEQTYQKINACLFSV